MLPKRENKIVKAPFSWSMRRREMLNRCPREYFCHYYGSAGGAFLKEGAQVCEKLHLARNTVCAESYVSNLICKVIRQLFNANAADTANFVSEVEVQFEKEFRLMLSGKPFLDHKLPLLLELVQLTETPEALRIRVSELLKKRSGKLIDCGLEKVLQISPEKRLELPFPLKISWNELDCWCTPIGAYLEEGCFCALCAGSESEENCALMSFYALEHFRCPPDKVKLFYLGEERIYEGHKVNSFSAPFRRIREDVEVMKLLELKGAENKKESFPQHFSLCGKCRFNNICSLD